MTVLQTSDTNAVIESVTAILEFVQQDGIATFIALAVGAYMLYLLYRRSTDTADPSVRKSFDTAVGSYSMLMSGAFAIAGLAAVVALVTWPAPTETPILGVLLVGAVVYAAAMEYRESREEGG